MGQGGSICAHGGCRSAKEYAISEELKKLDAPIKKRYKENKVQ